MPGIEAGQFIFEAFKAMDKLGDDRPGFSFQIHRGALKKNFGVIDNGHAVGNVEDVGNIVTDDNRTEFEFFLIVGDHGEDRVFSDGVQPGGGLVKQYNFRVRDQGSPESDPFLHAAGNLCRKFVPYFGEFKLVDPLVYPLPDLVAAHAGFLP